MFEWDGERHGSCARDLSYAQPRSLTVSRSQLVLQLLGTRKGENDAETYHSCIAVDFLNVYRRGDSTLIYGFAQRLGSEHHLQIEAKDNRTWMAST